MARLLRGTGEHFLRPPTVVAPSKQFRPLRVTLAVRSSRADLHRYRTIYWVTPPTVVVLPPFRPVKVTLAPSTAEDRRLQFKVQYDLHPPVVVGASITFAPIRTRLEQPPLAVTRRFKSQLRPPVVVGPSIVFSPVAVYTRTAIKRASDQARHAPKSRLLPPATLAAVVSALLAPIEIRLARLLPSRKSSYELRPPTVVAPSITFAPLRVKLAQPPAASRKTGSELRSPILAAAVAALAAPIEVRLARARARIQAKSRLGQPALALAAFLAAPIITRFARRKPVPPPTTRFLRAPAVVAPSVVFLPVRTRLAYSHRPPRVQFSLHGPTVMGDLAFTVGFYDVPTPVAGAYDNATPGGQFDGPTPSAGGYDEAAPDGHYDEPTPEVTLV